MAEAYQVASVTKQLNEIIQALKKQADDRKWAVEQALIAAQDKAEIDPMKLADDISRFLLSPLTSAEKQIADFLAGLQ